MSDWPSPIAARGLIHPYTPESVGGLFTHLATTFTTNGIVYPTANLAFLFPFEVTVPFPIKTFWWFNGSAVAGNVDAAVFGLDASLIVNAGTTVQSGTNTIQTVTPTAMLLDPGAYYLAIAASSTSAKFQATTSNTAPWSQMAGVCQATLSGLPFTNGPTLASVSANTYIPLFGICDGTLV